MNTFLESLSVLAAFGLIVCYVHDWRAKPREKKAYSDGYTAGRRDADKWWLEMEQQVRETQKEIWREK